MPQSLGRPLRVSCPDDTPALAETPAAPPSGVVVVEAAHPGPPGGPERRRLTALSAAHAALVAAPEHSTLDEALRWAAQELVGRFGFDRAMALQMDQHVLRINRTVFRDQPELAGEAQHHAEKHPVELRPDSLELEMVRRRSPALVDPVGDRRAWHPITDHLQTRAYVAAPITAFGKVVATLHADTHFTGHQADTVDRDVLARFAQVCTTIVERALLLEELSRLRAAIRANAAQLLALTAVEGLDLRWVPQSQPATGPAEDRTLADGNPSRLPLTSREIEVLHYMADGATSTEIARKLFISTGTVKTHAHNILRKLGASTRAEAVARFLRG